jgi:hypothetical protein
MHPPGPALVIDGRATEEEEEIDGARARAPEPMNRWWDLHAWTERELQSFTAAGYLTSCWPLLCALHVRCLCCVLLTVPGRPPAASRYG